jgi:hypothetical protein
MHVPSIVLYKYVPHTYNIKSNVIFTLKNLCSKSNKETIISFTMVQWQLNNLLWFFSIWVHVQLAFVIFQLNKVVTKVLGDQVLVAIKIGVYHYQPKSSYCILWYGHYDTCSVCFKVSSTWFMIKIGIYACTINPNTRLFFWKNWTWEPNYQFIYGIIIVLMYVDP